MHVVHQNVVDSRRNIMFLSCLIKMRSYFDCELLHGGLQGCLVSREIGRDSSMEQQELLLHHFYLSGRRNISMKKLFKQIEYWWERWESPCLYLWDIWQKKGGLIYFWSIKTFLDHFSKASHLGVFLHSCLILNQEILFYFYTCYICFKCN